MIAPLLASGVRFPEARSFELFVAGRPFSDHANEVKVEFPEDGSSRMTFVSREPLDGYTRAPVHLTVNGFVYFAGRLARPGDPEDFFRRQAVALGPFAEMQGVPFGEQVDYRGMFLEKALYDITSYRRTRYRSGTVEVRGGRSYDIGQAEEAVFVEEVALNEAAESLMASADFVASDMSGNVAGRRLFLPAPRPGAQTKAKRVFTEDDYPTGGLKLTEEETGYSSVVAFRRNEDGTYAVRQKAPVGASPSGGESRYDGPERIHYIPEFVGSQEQAKRAAYDAARRLEREKPFELADVPLDEELMKFDQVEVRRLKERRDGVYREAYACMYSGAGAAEISSWTMSFAGQALLLRAEKVGAARVSVPERMSAGVIP